MGSNTLTFTEGSQDQVQLQVASEGWRQVIDIGGRYFYLTPEQSVDLGTFLVNHAYPQTVRNIRDRRNA